MRGGLSCLAFEGDLVPRFSVSIMRESINTCGGIYGEANKNLRWIICGFIVQISKTNHIEEAIQESLQTQLENQEQKGQKSDWSPSEENTGQIGFAYGQSHRRVALIFNAHQELTQYNDSW